MPQKGFTMIVNKLHIHAMRSTPNRDVQAGQSEAQFFHIYRRDDAGRMVLVERSLSLDSAFDFCLPTLH
ncbi:hypothetical protein IPF36_16705 [Cupriavidus sp. IK-TO18]|uniref:Uncharacterized protein n=2 Tax=Burkholderiaceae TaxID=119060 RepID=A0A4P7LJQ5_9BURK|nr:hypothetical protein [Cupriavidus sp. IK-TO18]QBY56494.1 hypothetical protein E0W60_35710 [Cupriavidus oxalaticus]